MGKKKVNIIALQRRINTLLNLLNTFANVVDGIEDGLVKIFEVLENSELGPVKNDEIILDIISKIEARIREIEAKVNLARLIASLASLKEKLKS